MARDSAPAKPAQIYEDRAYRPGELPAEIASPLAPFEGARPPAPAWFDAALADEPERTFVESGGTKIETLIWGERGKPGLLLVHGNGAHADWWSFIAPMFAEDYRVAAFSLAGAGDSDWRDHYGSDAIAADAEAVSHAAGLYEGGRKPVYIGHSFGGGQVYLAAARYPERMHAAVIVDSGFGRQPPEATLAAHSRAEHLKATGGQLARVYPTVEEALKRFRLAPPQPAENLYVVDHIARHAMRPATAPDGTRGWSWKFDPNMWSKFDRPSIDPLFNDLPPITVPAAHIVGEHSVVVRRRERALADNIPEIEIPEAHHHVMVDQPLALVAAIRATLAGWRA